MTQNKISGIILAAGLGSRMKKIKPLMPIGGVFAIERVISAYFAGGIKDIHLVLGHRYDEIIALLPYKNQINIVFNPQYQTGMLSSLRAGVSSIGSGAESALMTPADYPLIDPETIADIKACYEKTGSDIVIPKYNDIAGHPCLFSMKYKDDILYRDLPNGFRSVLEENKQKITYVQSNNKGITMDMDTIEDYHNILGQLSHMQSFWRNIANEILKKENTPQNIINHGKAVSRVSCIIARGLIKKGFSLDLDLLMAAALLHDFKKSEKNHAQSGGLALSDMGYPTLGKIVCSHMGLGIEPANKISEREILFLSDKLIKDTALVSIDSRFSYSYEKFKDSADITAQIKKKEKLTKDMKNKIQDALSCDFDALINEDFYD